jgi:hypothetical protein
MSYYRFIKVLISGTASQHLSLSFKSAFISFTNLGIIEKAKYIIYKYENVILKPISKCTKNEKKGDIFLG